MSAAWWLARCLLSLCRLTIECYSQLLFDCYLQINLALLNNYGHCNGSANYGLGERSRNSKYVHFLFYPAISLASGARREETFVNGIRTIVEYKDEEVKVGEATYNEHVKITSTFRVEVKRVPKSIAERKVSSHNFA
jgi:hypothetical protein